MMIERDGKFFKQEVSEREISELEFMREKIKELEGQIVELQRRPTYIPYISIAEPNPCQPWTITYNYNSVPLNNDLTSGGMN